MKNSERLTEIPIYRVLDVKNQEEGIYKKSIQYIVLDQPSDLLFEIISNNKIGLINYFGSDSKHPIFLRVDSMTSKEIDGKLYCCLVKEFYNHWGLKELSEDLIKYVDSCLEDIVSYDKFTLSEYEQGYLRALHNLKNWIESNIK